MGKSGAPGRMSSSKPMMQEEIKGEKPSPPQGDPSRSFDPLPWGSPAPPGMGLAGYGGFQAGTAPWCPTTALALSPMLVCAPAPSLTMLQAATGTSSCTAPAPACPGHLLCSDLLAPGTAARGKGAKQEKNSLFTSSPTHSPCSKGQQGRGKSGEDS